MTIDEFNTQLKGKSFRVRPKENPDGVSYEIVKFINESYVKVQWICDEELLDIDYPLDVVLDFIEQKIWILE